MEATRGRTDCSRAVVSERAVVVGPSSRERMVSLRVEVVGVVVREEEGDEEGRREMKERDG